MPLNVCRKPPFGKKLVTLSRYQIFMTLEGRAVQRLIDDPKIAELLSEISDFAAFELDLKGICTKWEPLSKNYQRADQSEIVGHCLEEFYPQSQVESGQYWRDMQTAAKHGRCDGKGWRLRKDGTRSWMHFILLARSDFKGDHVGYSGLVFDATRQKDNMSALHSSEAALKIVVQRLNDFALYTLDSAGRVSNWNSGAERIKGFARDEIIGAHFARFFADEDRAQGVPETLLRIAVEKGSCDTESWQRRKDGSLFRAHLIIEPLYDDDKEFAGYGVINRDITEKYRTAQDLAVAHEALGQSEKMRSLGELTGGIAHDFNNLLTVVRGSAELLRHSDLSEEKRDRHLMAIIETADRAAELTGQLLSFARRQPLQPKKIYINALIAEMADLLKRTLGNGISILNIPQQDLWQVCVDPAQLQNVILNAAINARDAMGSSGTLTIATRNISRGADGEVRLSISDTGEGMTDEVRGRAFEPFFTTKAPGKGTGLGLSQAYGFAGQSGGRLELLSEPGRGTSLNLYLPRAGDAALPVKAEDQTGEIPQGTRILLVEDSRTVAVFAQSLLEDMGCEFVHAATAEEALAMFEQDPEGFDIVFSDIVMPGLSGLDLAAKLRTQRPTLPILLATGYSEAAARGEGSEFPILPKPYKRDKLSAMLSQTMSDFSQAANATR